jgi:hypothetical protein
MVVLTGACNGSRKVNDSWSIVEYVRTENGDVFFRTINHRSKGKWTFDGNSPVDAVAYKGNTWMTGAGLLSLLSNIRLPKV